MKHFLQYFGAEKGKDMSDFGNLLRHWRKAKRFSQLELALQANVSTRHISFLETGRAQPSREMVTLLLGILDVPHRDRNATLQTAGFSHQYSRLDLAEPLMEPILKAVDFVLLKHEPYPASLLDSDWNLIRSNRVHQQMFAALKSGQSEFPDTRNIMKLIFHPDGLRPMIENWDEVACLLLQRLHRERILYQQRSSELLDEILGYPDIPKDWKSFQPAYASHPMLSLKIRMGDRTISMFSALSTFGTAIDVTAQELILEQFFPTDPESEQFFQSLASQ